MSVNTPPTVQAAAWAWFAALIAGVCEAAVVVADFAGSPAALVPGLGVRLAIYAAVAWTVLRMRRGSNIARICLAVLLGGVGTLSLVYEPIAWLAAGNSWRDAVSGADLPFALTAASRAAHVLAVFAAVALMFVPASHRYFRAGAATARTAVAARP